MESALAISYEKFAMDIDMLRMVIDEFRPLEITEDLLVFNDQVAAGHTGTFLATPWTVANFRDCFFRAEVATVENIQSWEANGSRDAADRATDHWKDKLASYEEPWIDDTIREELEAFVARRKEEIMLVMDDDGDLLAPAG